MDRKKTSLAREQRSDADDRSAREMTPDERVAFENDVVQGGESLDPAPTASPSGATAQTKERVTKFDEEGGDQPQAPTQQAVDEELARIHKDE